MGWFEHLCHKLLPHKELGNPDYGEEFTRFKLLKTPLFSVYLHRLYAPFLLPHCHDHPWSFLAVILWGGYWETCRGGTFWRGPGSVLYRHATFKHNVVTHGGANWSLIVTTRKFRDWKFFSEEGASCKSGR